jgi:hypothetical protein
VEKFRLMATFMATYQTSTAAILEDALSIFSAVQASCRKKHSGLIQRARQHQAKPITPELHVPPVQWSAAARAT